MIRKARISDVRSIQALVNSYADQGQMLPRSLNDLYENLRDFSVYDANPATHTGQWRVLSGSYDLIAGSTSNPGELVNGNGKCVTTTMTVQ